MKLFLDCSDLDIIRTMADQVWGVTTNPSLLRAAGVTNYAHFAKSCVREFPDHSLSFEVIGNDLDTIKRQVHQIASWGTNVFCKVPCQLTDGTSTVGLVDELTADGLHINVTALFTPEQVQSFNDVVTDRAECYLSIFAGRIADAGVDPVDIIADAVMIAAPNVQVLWASTREVYNIIQASDAGADIITVSPELLTKYRNNIGKDLGDFSRETIQMFFDDALSAGLTL